MLFLSPYVAEVFFFSSRYLVDFVGNIRSEEAGEGLERHTFTRMSGVIFMK